MYPVGILCQNDVVSTSMRRDHVASTLIRRHFHTKCPLGTFFESGKDKATKDSGWDWPFICCTHDQKLASNTKAS